MRKIHIDTDLGGDIDDLCALAMVLNWPDAVITGITTVADQDGKRAGYIQHALSLVKKTNLIVKSGADISNHAYKTKPEFPDEMKMWQTKVASVVNPPEEALELLKHSITQGSAIVAIGPYTNLYLLDQKYPGILKDAELYLMGGFINPSKEGYPDWNHEMDYNMQQDIVAAKHVLENSSPLLITLPASLQTAFTKSHLPRLRQSNDLAKLIANQGEVFDEMYHNDKKWGEKFEKVPNDIINFQYDPLACSIALGYTGVKIELERLKFEIENDFLVLKHDITGKQTRIVTEVNGEQFNNLWLELVCR